MRGWGALFCVGMALLGLAGTAFADETKLLFTTITPPGSGISRGTYQPWVEKINQDGKGVVNIDMRDGFALVQSTNFYDRLRDNVVQISFGSMNYVAGKFKLSLFVALPFLIDSAEEESVIYYRIIKSGALDSEFDEIMPLFAICFPENGLHFIKQQPEALTSLHGLKIIVSGQTSSDLIERLGGTPSSIQLTDAYTALQHGAADGMHFPWAALSDFKFDEVMKFHILASLGGGPGGVWMTKKEYQSLSPEARKIIDENSGEAESRHAGKVFDELQAKAIANISGRADQKVVALNEDQAAKWKAMSQPLLDEWAARSPEHAKVLTLVKQEVARYRAGQ